MLTPSLGRGIPDLKSAQLEPSGEVSANVVGALAETVSGADPEGPVRFRVLSPEGLGGWGIRSSGDAKSRRRPTH